jgi:hypothetical protein
VYWKVFLQEFHYILINSPEMWQKMNLTEFSVEIILHYIDAIGLILDIISISEDKLWNG